MGIYLRQDIETDDAGEIQFEHGDVKVASVKRSHLQSINWLILSNRADVVLPDSAADLGAFYGALNIARTHRAMEHNIRRAILEQRLFLPQDVAIRIVPIDATTVAVTSQVRGQFPNPDGTTDETCAILGYVYPFGTGVPKVIQE